MNLTVLQWNLRSFPRNKLFLQSAIDELTPKVICLQETWAKPTTKLQLSGYSLSARLDRRVGVGGGVSIHVQSSIPTSPVLLPEGVEAAAVKVHLQSHSLTICSLYIPPDVPTEFINTKIAPLTTLSHTLFLYVVTSMAITSPGDLPTRM